MIHCDLLALIKLFSLNARIKIDLANEYLVKAEEIAKGNQSAYFKGVVLNQRAVYFNFKGNYDSTFAYATKACEILEKSPFRIPYAKALGTLSTALGTQNQKRIDILKKCQLIYEEFKDTSSLIWTYNAISNNYTFLNKFDSALYYSNDALRLAKKTNSTADIGSTLNKICNIYFEQQNFDQAIKTGLDALEYHKKSGSTT
jgi:tetratricopeptide (TPR) repeat protein